MCEGATSLEKFLVETNINHIGQPGDPPHQTLAELTALVLELNRRLQVAAPDLTGDLAKKLAKWLQRLMVKMNKCEGSASDAPLAKVSFTWSL